MQCWRLECLKLLCGNLEDIEEPHQLIKEWLIDAVHLLCLVTGGKRLIVAIELTGDSVRHDQYAVPSGGTALLELWREMLVESDPFHVCDELLAVLQQIEHGWCLC